MSTMIDYARQHHMPLEWLHLRMAGDCPDLETALKEFLSPTTDEVHAGKVREVPISRTEVISHVNAHYDLSFADLLQYWATLGYRLSFAAWHLGATSSRISSTCTFYRINIQWARGISYTRVPFGTRVEVNGTSMTLKEFADNYGQSAPALSSKWERYTREQIQAHVRKIVKVYTANATYKFLTGTL